MYNSLNIYDVNFEVIDKGLAADYTSLIWKGGSMGVYVTVMISRCQEIGVEHDLEE